MCPWGGPGYLEHMGESDSGTEDRRRIEVNWVQSMAGAFAAVTSAVLLSTVGVAGTVIGAAIGSVVATVGGAVYSYYIAVTKDRVARAHAVAATRVVRAQSKLNEATQRLAVDRPQADEQIAGAGEDLEQAKVELEDAEDAPDRIDWRTMLAGLPWKRIAVGASAIFVVAMLAILTFELITGRAVSSYTGGSDSHQRTSIPGIGRGGGGPATPEPTTVPDQTPSQGATSPSSGTETPTPSETSSSIPSPTYTESPQLPEEVPGGEPTTTAPTPTTAATTGPTSAAPTTSPTP